MDAKNNMFQAITMYDTADKFLSSMVNYQNVKGWRGSVLAGRDCESETISSHCKETMNFNGWWLVFGIDGGYYATASRGWDNWGGTGFNSNRHPDNQFNYHPFK